MEVVTTKRILIMKSTNESKIVDAALDALIALAVRLHDKRRGISEEEIARLLETEVELPPSYEAAFRALGPNLMQRLIKGELKAAQARKSQRRRKSKGTATKK